MTRETVKREILEIAGKYRNREFSDYMPAAEEDAFVGALAMDEWEYFAFITEVEMQLGVSVTEQETSELYPQNLKALIDLLHEKIGD